MTDNLTFEKLLQAKQLIEDAYPILLYATSESVNREQLLYHRETDTTPAFFVFHPADLGVYLDAFSKHYRCIHLRDYKQPIQNALKIIRKTKPVLLLWRDKL